MAADLEGGCFGVISIVFGILVIGFAFEVFKGVLGWEILLSIVGVALIIFGIAVLIEK